MAFDDTSLSRRGLLRTCGAGLATAATVATAGCSGLPPLGTEIRYGSVDVPAAAEPTYRDWLPAPAALPAEGKRVDGGEDDDTDEASDDVMVYAPPPADAPTWTRASVARTFLTFRADYVGVDVDDVNVAFATGWGDDAGGVAVLLGEIDPAAVRETIDRTPYEPAETETNYAVYTRPDKNRSVGVLPTGLVFADGPRAREVIATVVAAGRGEAPRLHERDSDFAALTDSAGQHRWAWFWPDGVDSATGHDIREDTVGWATSFAHESDTAYLVQTWVFPESYDLTAGKVKTALKAESRAGLPGATDASAVDVSVDGRVATIEMQMGRSAFRSTTETVLVTPFATWRGSYDESADRLTIHHEAGDPVRTDWLRIAGAGNGQTAVDSQSVGDRMEPGESVTVSTAGAESGTTVRLVYEEPDGHKSTALFTYDLP